MLLNDVDLPFYELVIKFDGVKMQVQEKKRNFDQISLAVNDRDNKKAKISEPEDLLSRFHDYSDVFKIIIDMLQKNTHGNLARVSNFWHAQINKVPQFKFEKKFSRDGLEFLRKNPPNECFKIQKFHFCPISTSKVIESVPDDMGKIFGKFTNLKTLQLSRYAIDDSFLSSLLQCKEGVEEISISECSIEVSNMQKFSKLINELTQLNKFSVDSLQVLGEGTREPLFKELSFQKLTLKRHSLKGFVDLFGNENSTLYKLSLIDSPIRASSLLEIIKKCKKLNKLVLSNVKILTASEIDGIEVQFPNLKIKTKKTEIQSEKNLPKARFLFSTKIEHKNLTNRGLCSVKANPKP